MLPSRSAVIFSLICDTQAMGITCMLANCRPRGALLRRPAGEGQGAAKRVKLEPPPAANGHAAHVGPLQFAAPLQQPHPQPAHPLPPAAQVRGLLEAQRTGHLQDLVQL